MTKFKTTKEIGDMYNKRWCINDNKSLRTIYQNKLILFLNKQWISKKDYDKEMQRIKDGLLKDANDWHVSSDEMEGILEDIKKAFKGD